MKPAGAALVLLGADRCQQIGCTNLGGIGVLNRYNHFQHLVAALELGHFQLTGIHHFLKLHTVFTRFQLTPECARLCTRLKDRSLKIGRQTVDKGGEAEGSSGTAAWSGGEAGNGATPPETKTNLTPRSQRRLQESRLKESKQNHTGDSETKPTISPREVEQNGNKKEEKVSPTHSSSQSPKREALVPRRFARVIDSFVPAPWFHSALCCGCLFFDTGEKSYPRSVLGVIGVCCDMQGNGAHHR